jgi:LacI family transcriptional regulator
MMQSDVDRIREWNPDGVIAVIHSHEALEPWLELPCPVVNVGTHADHPRLHSVTMDEAAVGRLAAEHLTACGFQRFGFVGYQGNPASARRRQGFCSALSHPDALEVFDSPFGVWEMPDGRDTAIEDQVKAWMDKLEKPVGILAWNDQTALGILQWCHAMDLRVPDEVAVVGVDDDETWCQLSLPPLTSVRTPLRRIGFQGAATLDTLMAGGKAPARLTELPPEALRRRKSTDALAVDDPLLVEALRFIRENVHRRLAVSDVVDAVTVSRRLLEVRFRQKLGRSILAEIHRVQIQVAEELLRNTGATMPTIAARAGFRDVNHLTRVFGKSVGRPPAAYRQWAELA